MLRLVEEELEQLRGIEREAGDYTDQAEADKVRHEVAAARARIEAAATEVAP